MTASSAESAGNFARLAAFMVFAAVFLFYSLQSHSLGFIYDDREQILADSENLDFAVMQKIFTSPHFTNNSYYRPLARLFLKLQLSLIGKNPGNLHLGNCLVAALMALLLFLILKETCSSDILLPAIISIGTALHPITSSCVYMISGQEALLASFLILLSVWLFRMKKFIPAGFVTLAAMLCRENALMLPPVLTLMSLLTAVPHATNTVPTYKAANDAGNQSAGNTFLIRQLAPVWAAALFYLLIRTFILSSSNITSVSLQPAKPVMAFLYLFQTVLLPDFELVYEPPEAVWMSPRTIFALAVSIFGLLRIHRTQGKAAIWPWLTWIVIMFLPTANLLPQQTAYDERHNLITLPGFAGILAAVTTSPQIRRRRPLIFLLCAGMLLLGTISYHRAHFFANDYQFASQWLKRNPAAGEAWAIMGSILREQENRETALKAFEQAVALSPAMSSAWDNLGSLLGESGKSLEAEQCFRKAIALAPQTAYYRYNLGINLLDTGKIFEAYVHLNLASMYSDSGLPDPDQIRAMAFFNFIYSRYSLTNPIF